MNCDHEQHDSSNLGGPILINFPSMSKSSASFNAHHKLANQRSLPVCADQSEAAKWKLDDHFMMMVSGANKWLV